MESRTLIFRRVVLVELENPEFCDGGMRTTFLLLESVSRRNRISLGIQKKSPTQRIEIAVPGSSDSADQNGSSGFCCKDQEDRVKITEVRRKKIGRLAIWESRPCSFTSQKGLTNNQPD